MASNQNEINIYKLLQMRYGIIGESEPMRDAMFKLYQAAPTDLTVLLTGETGTGKEVFANTLHNLSKRKSFPFVSVNCGAIPETLLESELFGHEKGAFTGAIEQRKGFFEVADRGTIFLDEIGEMPVGTQVKLLRILESGEFSRLGSSTIHRVDVRVIAATNRELKYEVAHGNFRQDLFFRLNSLHIILPPLRKRPEDIPIYVDYFAKKVCEKHSIVYKGISSDGIAFLKNLPWHGNIRELKNLIETIITLEKASYITYEMLNKYIPPSLPPAIYHDQPVETSLIKFREKDYPQQLELGLIFKTLLELKNDINEIKENLNNVVDSLDSLKYNSSVFQPEQAQVIQSPEEFFDELDDIKLSEIEKKLIISALKKSNGNRRHAASMLGISERTLYRKIIGYGIN